MQSQTAMIGNAYIWLPDAEPYSQGKGKQSATLFSSIICRCMPPTYIGVSAVDKVVICCCRSGKVTRQAEEFRSVHSDLEFSCWVIFSIL